MSTTAHREKHFQNYIVDRLVEQGWTLGTTKGYDTEFAVYPQDIEDWIKASGQEKKWENLERLHGDKTRQMLLERLAKALEKHGTAHLLCKGFSIAGAGQIDMSGRAPEDRRNPSVENRYQANILRVVPELKYHPARELAIDLVFFINGLPVATVEVKTDFTQSVETAIDQYKNDRKPYDPKTRRKEPLLTFKRGAVVHFAVSDSEIWMTTKLRGRETVFLPFNKGNHGRKGNPEPVKKADGSCDYPVAYFWEDVCQKEAWLRIFHNFVYEADKERLIFPRFHQWDAVSKMIKDARQNGAGMSYLFDHSAGSGKTSTISWTAHELIKLRQENGEAVFSSVIIVTDRNVLDGQLQDAVKKIDHQLATIATITNEKGGESKSRQLAKELSNRTPIIVVTIQTFPFAMEEIITNKALKNKNFAVIIDEAHNFQTGATASKLQTALKMSGEGKMEEMTVEELLARIQSSRTRPENISYFAFTGTPKHQTLMLFGRPEETSKPLSKENPPHAFHRYSMRQAIEEGFILDVIKGFMPYKTAYRLSKMSKDDKRVGSKSAKRALAQWLKLHATNVTQKVEFIIEHFAKNVAPLLNGTAKAMIVTSSRAAVVRYKLALDAYMQKHPEHRYISLVAFSGTVSGKDVIHQEDDQSGLSAKIAEEAEFTEANMNPEARGEDLRFAFNRDECRIMLVANKFQIGFDQPKLVAMYVDKKIGNEVEIVQTFSRLNRTFPGKDKVFIVDFVNDAEHVQAAFKLYDQGAQLETVQDLNIVYEIKERLDCYNLYTKEDLEAFKQACFKTIDSFSNSKETTQHKALFTATDRPTRLYNERLKSLFQAAQNWETAFLQAKEKGDTEGEKKADQQQKETSEQLTALQGFKSDLGRFCRVYSYIAQLIDFNDPDLENFAAFAKLLQKRLSDVPRENIDLSGIVLEYFRISPSSREKTGEDSETPVLRPIGAGGEGVNGDKKQYMKELLEKLNLIFGETTPLEDQIAFVNHIKAIASEDQTVMAQVKNNPKEQVMKGNLPGKIEEGIVRAFTSHQKLAELVLSQDKQSLNALGDLVYDLLHTKTDLTLS